MATRGSYAYLYGRILGGIHNVTFMQFSTKMMLFEQKDSQGFEKSYNSYEQYPLEKFFIFTIYQNYTLALILDVCSIPNQTWQAISQASLFMTKMKNAPKIFSFDCV